jgi:hypothetical protein
MRRTTPRAMTRVTPHARDEAFEITPQDQRVYARTVESCLYKGAAREVNASITEAPLGCHRLAIAIGGLSEMDEPISSGKRTLRGLIFEEQLDDLIAVLASLRRTGHRVGVLHSSRALPATRRRRVVQRGTESQRSR